MICQAADNCAANKKVVRFLKIPHVGCRSHLLNLEVNYMVEMTADLAQTLALVDETMAN